jgi:predicted lipoprotein with Yx(FWY)xxD motif
MRKIVGGVIALALFSTACGEDDDGAADGEWAPAVAIVSGSLGDYLVDPDGATLYLFMPDGGDVSTCYDDCADLWPPLEGPVSAGEGVDSALIGTTERTDGTVQATYNGHPLYSYTPDGGAGPTSGQGVGDVWWVVDAAGDPIM